MVAFNFQTRTNNIIKRLKILGLWYERGTSYSTPYFIYSVFANICYNLHNMAVASNIIFHYDNMEELTLTGLVTLTKLLTNLKAYYVIAHQSKILKVHEISKNASFQPKNSRQVKLAKSTFKIFDVMYSVHNLSPALVIIFFSLYSAREMTTNKRLPFNAWYPFNFKESPYFEMAYVHQVVSCLIMGYTHVDTDGLAFNLIAVINVQLQFLCDNLRNLFKASGDRSEMGQRKALFECIQHHKEILLCYEDVYKMLNANLFGQFILSATGLCLTTLQMSVTSPMSTQFVALVMYEFAVFTQLLMFCWWGNELIIKSEEIPKTAYESDWIETSVVLNKSLMFFIHRTQKPMVLYAVDFFTISLNSFVLIIKNSYSFFAVLRHLNSKDEELL